MYINISGNYDLKKLKKYADDLKDKIESFPEITRVDLVGALDREIQVNVDMFKMQAAGATFRDVQNAIAYENNTISAGDISVQNMSRNVRVVGEFRNIDTNQKYYIYYLKWGNCNFERYCRSKGWLSRPGKFFEVQREKCYYLKRGEKKWQKPA